MLGSDAVDGVDPRGVADGVLQMLERVQGAFVSARRFPETVRSEIK